MVLDCVLFTRVITELAKDFDESSVLAFKLISVSIHPFRQLSCMRPLCRCKSKMNLQVTLMVILPKDEGAFAISSRKLIITV